MGSRFLNRCKQSDSLINDILAFHAPGSVTYRSLTFYETFFCSSGVGHDGEGNSVFNSVALVLAWRIPGTGEPGRLPSMGSHRVGHD